MRRYNLNDPAFADDETDPDGFKTAYDRIGPKLGGDKLGATHYLIRPGQHLCPYHYEYGEEEWLLVLEGQPSVRHPGGTDELLEGVIVAFVEGPDGAHQGSNFNDADARLLMCSKRSDTRPVVYPDSDKIMFIPKYRRDHIIVQRAAAVDYWEGER